MTEMDCSKLEEAIGRPGGLQTVADRYAFVDSLTGVERCVADGLRRCADAEDWSRFEQYVYVASRHPDPRYVDVLCHALLRHDLNVSFDDIVVALGEIADPRSVPFLVDAMWWRPDWDEYLQLAKKCVWALARIGTPEAIEALRDAATVGSDILREEAQYELNRRP